MGSIPTTGKNHIRVKKSVKAICRRLLYLNETRDYMTDQSQRGRWPALPSSTPGPRLHCSTPATLPTRCAVLASITPPIPGGRKNRPWWRCTSTRLSVTLFTIGSASFSFFAGTIGAPGRCAGGVLAGSCAPGTEPHAARRGRRIARSVPPDLIL